MCETRDLGTTLQQWHTFIVERASSSGHEIRLPKRREENALETGEIDLLEEVGSKARARRTERRYLAPASSGSVAKEDKGMVQRVLFCTFYFVTNLAFAFL